MKTLSLTLPLVIGILMAGQLPAVGPITAGNTVMIVQTSSDPVPNIAYIYKDYDKGEAPIEFPISEKGDTFDLYVLGDIWDPLTSKWIKKLYWVDSKVVKAYSPEGSIVAETGDKGWSVGDSKGNYVKRTRADMPYTIKSKVSGLLISDSSAPPSAKSVRLDRQTLNYTPGNSTSDTDPAYNSTGPNNILSTEETFSLTGDDTRIVNDRLKPLGSNLVCGEERWQLTRLADVNPVLSETVIQSVTVQVWPKARAVLSGITNGQEILDSVPQLYVQLNESYPDSNTYCMIYKGGSTTGTLIPYTRRCVGKYFNDKYDMDGDGLNNYPGPPEVQPRTEAIFMVNLNDNAPTDGDYTIKVFTETPFNDYKQLDELASIDFKVNRKTAIRATLSSGN